MFIKEESFSTISDVVEKLREEYQQLGENDLVTLILDNFSLPPWETVDLLQSGDLIKVTRSQPRPSGTQAQRVNKAPPHADERKAVVKFSDRSLEDLLLPFSDDESDETLDQLDIPDQSDPVDDEVDNVKLGALEDEERKPCESELQQDRVRREQIEFLMNLELLPVKDAETTSKKEKFESTNTRPRRSGRIAQKKSYM